MEWPSDLAAGVYRLELGVIDGATGRAIDLALVEERRTAEGYFVVGDVVAGRRA